MPKQKDLLDYVYPIKRRHDDGLDPIAFHHLLDEAFRQGTDTAYRLAGKRMPLVNAESRRQLTSLQGADWIGPGSARALHAAFMFAMGMRLPDSKTDQVRKSRILALSQSIRSSSLAQLWLAPRAVQSMQDWRPPGPTLDSWQSQCRGAASEARVASAILASSLPCLYPDPRFDSWGWTDLLCGPFPNGGLFIQVKSSRDPGFRAIAIDGPPAPGAIWRNRLLSAWNGGRKFNESFGISWLSVLVEAGPPPQSPEASAAEDLALGEDLMKIAYAHGYMHDHTAP